MNYEDQTPGGRGEPQFDSHLGTSRVGCLFSSVQFGVPCLPRQATHARHGARRNHSSPVPHRSQRQSDLIPRCLAPGREFIQSDPSHPKTPCLRRVSKGLPRPNVRLVYFVLIRTSISSSFFLPPCRGSHAASRGRWSNKRRYGLDL